MLRCSAMVGLAIGGFVVVRAAQGSAARVAQFRSGLPRDNRLRARHRHNHALGEN